ncbi:MAG: hypothetical protein ACXVCP_12745 [Bdellovibrio sp.]
MTKARSQLKTKGLSAALIIFFISSHAFSVSQINSEFELMLPRQFEQLLIDKKWETLSSKEFQGNWQLPDQQTISQDVPVDIKNISLNIQSHLQKPALQEDKQLLQLQSKDLRAQITIGEISVDHVVERVIGGIIGRFRIQASCKNVILNLAPEKGNLSMLISAAVQSSNAGMNLENFNLSWAPGSWSTENLQCDGAQGFTDLLKTEIDKMTQDSEKFLAPQRENIRNYIQSSLQKIKLDFSQPKQLVVSRPDIQVIMNVSEYKDLQQSGASLRGILQINFLKVKDNLVKTLTLSDNNASQNNSNATLQLPKDFFKEVAMATYSQNTWLHTVSSDKLAGFSTLMNSRLSQFFVWPELTNYSTSAKFLFDIYSDQNITIDGQGMAYQLKGNFNSLMQAPRGGKYIPFMNFEIPLTSKIQLKVDNGKMNATFSNPTMSLHYSWDKSYVGKYHPSQKFDAQTIRDKIVAGLKDKIITYNIPKIPVTEDISLKILKAAVPTGKQDFMLQLTP